MQSYQYYQQQQQQQQFGEGIRGYPVQQYDTDSRDRYCAQPPSSYSYRNHYDEYAGATRGYEGPREQVRAAAPQSQEYSRYGYDYDVVSRREPAYTGYPRADQQAASYYNNNGGAYAERRGKTTVPAPAPYTQRGDDCDGFEGYAPPEKRSTVAVTPAPDVAMYSVTVPSYQDVNCIIEPTMYEGGLYLGNMQAATNYELLQRYNIKAVLNITTQGGRDYPKSLVPETKFVHAFDDESHYLKKEFDDCIEFIENARKNRMNVLVHCMAGISRSATVTIAYLMKSYNFSLEEAFKYARSKRPVIRPNDGFYYQLTEFEQELAQRTRSTAKKPGTKADGTPVFNWF
jgi:hypothetical protein